MFRRKRLLLYAALALAAPVPAFALGLTGQSSPAPGSLDASASLDSCGIFEQQIVCKVNVSFNQIPGADRYAANVTAPDGSVADYGDVGAGGGSLWVPYAGDGTYTVTVQAWGEPPKPKSKPKLLTTDKAKASGAAPARNSTATHHVQGPAQPASPDSSSGDAAPASPPPSSSDGSPTPDQGGGTTTTPDPGTSCVPPTPPPAPSTGDAGGSSGSTQGSGSDSAATLGGSDAAALQSQGEVPDSVTQPTCPDGTQPTDGNCCQQPTQ